MASVALSSLSPTLTVTVVAVVKVELPPRVAVTRTVFAPPFSVTAVCTPSVSVSASTLSVSAVGAASSSVMVPVACASVIVAPVASLNAIRKVSSPSCSVSAVVATVKVLVVSLTAKERVWAVGTAV